MLQYQERKCENRLKLVPDPWVTFLQNPRPIAHYCNLAFKKSRGKSSSSPMFSAISWDFSVRVTHRTCFPSPFADKELWTNSLAWTDNILSSVWKLYFIILLIFSSRSFAWELLMQSTCELPWRRVSQAFSVSPNALKFGSHVAHTSDHWENKQPIGSQCQKVDGLFFPVALNNLLAISRDRSYKPELSEVVLFLWGWGSVWTESCFCHLG